MVISWWKAISTKAMIIFKRKTHFITQNTTHICYTRLTVKRFVSQGKQTSAAFFIFLDNYCFKFSENPYQNYVNLLYKWIIKAFAHFLKMCSWNAFNNSYNKFLKKFLWHVPRTHYFWFWYCWWNAIKFSSSSPLFMDI